MRSTRGLNVVEHWNVANDFVFFAKRGELNTLMIQQILARPHWRKRLTAVDLRALTPLIQGT